MRSAISVWKRCDTNLNWALKHDLLELFRRQTGNLEVVVNYNCDVNYNFSWQEHTHSNFKYSSIFGQKMKNVALSKIYHRSSLYKNHKVCTAIFTKQTGCTSTTAKTGEVERTILRKVYLFYWHTIAIRITF